MSVSGSLLIHKEASLWLTGARGEFRFRLALDDHECYVVSRARPLRKLRQRRFNSIANSGSRCGDVARDDFVKPRRTKLFARWTKGLGHAVRIDHQHIAGLQLRASLAILRIGFDSEWKPPDASCSTVPAE